MSVVIAATSWPDAVLGCAGLAFVAFLAWLWERDR
jgi:hypothetical protein